VYSVLAGAYIMHDPAGDDTRQLSAVPTLVVPDGQEPFSIVKYGSSTATKPAGQDVVGAAAFATTGINKEQTIKTRFIFRIP